MQFQSHTKINKQQSLPNQEVFKNFKSHHQNKTKQIRKVHQKIQTCKQSDDIGQIQDHANMSSKEIKRLREQNRRANHKQYVAGLQAKLQKKEEQVNILNEKIMDLTQRLQGISYPKYCCKCSAALSETSGIGIEAESLNQKKVKYVEEKNSSSMEIENQIGEKDDFFDEEFIERVRQDERSLRINFGNNFMFIFITFCCLSAGCIADNAQLALEPIMPYRLKSEMCFLPTPQKLDKIIIFTPLQKFLNTPGYQLFRKQCKPILLDYEIEKASESLIFGFDFSYQLPTFRQINNWIISEEGALSSLSSNFMLRNVLNGYNYYV